MDNIYLFFLRSGSVLLDKVEYAILKHYKFKEYSFANLPNQIIDAVYFDFDWANFKDLQGIDRFKR